MYSIRSLLFFPCAFVLNDSHVLRGNVVIAETYYGKTRNVLPVLARGSMWRGQVTR